MAVVEDFQHLNHINDAFPHSWTRSVSHAALSQWLRPLLSLQTWSPPPFVSPGRRAHASSLSHTEPSTGWRTHSRPPALSIISLKPSPALLPSLFAAERSASVNLWVTSGKLSRAAALSLRVDISHPQGLGAAFPQAVVSCQTGLQRQAEHSDVSPIHHSVQRQTANRGLSDTCLASVSHLVVVEAFGRRQLHPELRPHSQDGQDYAHDGHEERQLDLSPKQTTNQTVHQKTTVCTTVSTITDRCNRGGCWKFFRILGLYIFIVSQASGVQISSVTCRCFHWRMSNIWVYRSQI